MVPLTISVDNSDSLHIFHNNPQSPVCQAAIQKLCPYFFSARILVPHLLLAYNDLVWRRLDEVHLSWMAGRVTPRLMLAIPNLEITKFMSIPFIVPGLIQRRSINLVIGSSGSGKTNFILPQLNAYAAGDNFLGYRLGAPPEQLGAITCHRTMDNIYYRVNELELDHLMAIKAFPITYWKPKPEDTDAEALEHAYAEDRKSVV